MIKSAEIHYIFPKYTGFMEDLCSTGVKQTKLMVDFWQNQVLDPNNIILYQPDDMFLEAAFVIMGSKDFDSFS